MPGTWTLNLDNVMNNSEPDAIKAFRADLPNVEILSGTIDNSGAPIAAYSAGATSGYRAVSVFNVLSLASTVTTAFQWNLTLPGNYANLIDEFSVRFIAIAAGARVITPTILRLRAGVALTAALPSTTTAQYATYPTPTTTPATTSTGTTTVALSALAGLPQLAICNFSAAGLRGGDALALTLTPDNAANIVDIYSMAYRIRCHSSIYVKSDRP